MPTYFTNDFPAAKGISVYSGQNNPANSELTSLFMKLRENASREQQQQAALNEQAREADQLNTYRGTELQARKDAEAQYYKSRTGETDSQKAEQAARAKFGWRGLQQDLKQKEADFNLYTGHVNALTQKLMKAGVQPQQLQEYLDGTAKAPPLLEADVKMLAKAIGLQQKVAQDADATVSQYNREFGLGVLLGVDRKTGRFAATQPYIPGQPEPTSPVTSGVSSGVGGGGSAPGAPGTVRGGGGPQFFGPELPPGWTAPPDGSGPAQPPAPQGTAGSFWKNVMRSVAEPWGIQGDPTGSYTPRAVTSGVISDVSPMLRGAPAPAPAPAVPIVRQPAVTPRYYRRNAQEAYMENLGVPPGFSEAAAQRPPTHDEIMAATAARDARVAARNTAAGVRVPARYFQGPAIPNPWDAPAATYGPMPEVNPLPWYNYPLTGWDNRPEPQE